MSAGQKKGIGETGKFATQSLGGANATVILSHRSLGEAYQVLTPENSGKVEISIRP